MGRDFKVELQWVVLGVYPASTALYWLLYLRLWAPITRRVFVARKAKLDRWSALQHACFYANANSCLHTGVVVVLLVVMLASDDELWHERLHPHNNNIGHAAMSFSLVRTSQTPSLRFARPARPKRPHSPLLHKL
jgi:hypothetical protein